MPRFGKDYKMYKKIVPSLQLDVTNVLEKGPRECVICGKLATKECKECYKVHGEDLYTIAFCDTCDELNHKQKRREHKRTKLREHKYFCEHTHSQQIPIIPREKMELFAVICIETSHYVSFVKNSNEGKEPKWVFYDSMADREGCNEGYNIPEVRYCPNLQKWITTSDLDYVDPDQPELQRRLFSDSYMCLYQNTQAMMFQ
uniref:USP domain-containing protein n=2 Tax=Octopus bimaculoides TaxID=37653 RepID=A0A0L8GFM2_OCTBM